MPRLDKLVRQIRCGPLWLTGICVAFSAGPLAAQAPRIGTIDVYGLRSVSEDTVRKVLAIQEGDPQLSPSQHAAIKRRLREIPGVVAAGIAAVCCDDGRVNLYVGIAEDSASLLEFRPPPQSVARLPEEIVARGKDFERALVRAVRAGNAKDDFSQGHSLMADSAARAVQQRFLIYAERDLDLLREVLRTSSDPEHRSLAAQVIGYAPDKREVIDDLVFAVTDPDNSVRNSATRALLAIMHFANLHPELGIQIAATPFLDMVNSFSWTDRNKASAVLLALTEGRDPHVLQQLREHALESLVEMARWKGPHRRFAYWLLGRIAGLSDEETSEAWADSEAREERLEQMIESIGAGSAGSS